MQPKISLNIYSEDYAEHLGTLELTDQSDFPLAISWSTGDFTDITKRSGSYTKTFKLPASKLNNRILKYIYQVGINFYQTHPTCKAEVLYNGIPFFSGRLKINGVSQGQQSQEYDVELVGENLDWVTYMKSHTIKEIDYGNRSCTYFNDEWSEVLNYQPQTIPATTQTHTLSEAFALASWQNFPQHFDYVYGLKSYGAWLSGNKVVAGDLRPDVSIRHIIIQSFQKAGYNVSSTFFNTDYFKRLVLVFTGDGFKKEPNSDTNLLFKAILCGTRDYANLPDNFRMPSFMFGITNCAGFFDNGPPHYNGVYYQVPRKCKLQFHLNATVRMDNYYENLEHYTLGIGKLTTSGIIQITEQEVSFSSNGESQDIALSTGFLMLQPGERIIVYANYKTSRYLLSKKSPRFKVVALAFFNETSDDIVEGETYHVAKVLPEIKQIDLLSGVMNMFNLYFRTDIANKTVYCEPRDQFLKPTTDAIDWTEKFDVGQEAEIQYLESYKRNLTFKYKVDSKDAFIKQLTETTQKHPGSLLHTLPPKYDPGNQELGAKDFAYTLSFQDWSIFNNLNPTNIAPEIPRLWKELTPYPEASYEYEPRIMYYEGFKANFLPNNNGQLKTSAWTFGAETFARFKYPLLTATSLNYGTQGGLVNTYYRNTLAQIEDGRQVLAWFKLNIADILNLDLQRPIYLNHPTLQGYYYITTITDYRPAEGLPVKVTLLPALANQNILIDLSNQVDYSSAMRVGPTIGRATGDASRFGNNVLGENLLTPSTVLNNGTGNWAPAGTGSIAIGQGAVANARNQTVLGAYNVVSSTDVMQVGAGTSPADRYRALTFTQDGNFLVQGGYLYTTDGREIMFASQRSETGQVRRFDKLHLKGNQ